MTNVELAKFVWDSVLTGVIGNAAYDGIKAILGSTFDRLKNCVNDQEREQFDVAIDLILETNQEIRNKLSSLASGTHIGVSQHHSGTGDNVAGDKIVNNYIAPGPMLVNGNNVITKICPYTGTVSVDSASLPSR